MVQPRVTAWLRPLLSLLALAGILSLAACGGGGGSPSNAYIVPAVPVVPPALTVLPATANVYSGVPATLTITSGTAPFSAFSNNAAILPVAQSAGTTIPLLASAVNVDTAVVITVRDASGQTVSAAITVKPSLLLPASITITGNPVCAGSNAQLCSGQDGTARVTVNGIGGATLSGRQVRFDVVLGTYSLIAANLTAPAQTVTVATDQNGLAAVTLRVPVNAVTQFATVRATDVASGSTVIGQFTIAQFINGNSVLSVIPTGVTTFTGPTNVECSSNAIATFYIFGGTPPYTVALNFPTAVSLVGTPVLASGGGFSIVTNGTCFTNLTFAITDAAGRTLLMPPTAINVLGTAAPAPPLAPQLVVTPGQPTGTATSRVACNGPLQFSYLISGGTAPFTAAASTGIVLANGGAVPTSPGTLSGTINLAPQPGGTNAIITIGDTSKPQQTSTQTIFCL